MSKDDVALSMPPAYPGLPEPTKTDVTHFPIFGSESANMLCKSCNLQISTRVDSKISGNGWAWAIVCCFCGSWIASCLVNCLPGFRKYTHSCPQCNIIVGEVEPKHSGAHMAIIVVSVLLVVILMIAYSLLSGHWGDQIWISRRFMDDSTQLLKRQWIHSFIYCKYKN